MKINRLELHAFGHFTGARLDFSSDVPGMHIVYGSNEAGKSSTLRALTSLLYGFSERSTDNFIHPYGKLLLGGTLSLQDGRKLSFLRRKRRKADLLDIEELPLEPAVLLPFLHGVDQNTFQTLYGIDHNVLVQGGEDILAQKGEVGQALFSAGSGVSSLKKLLESLENEADEIFKPRGSTKKLNKNIKQYNQLKRQVKEASLSGPQWLALQKEMRLAEEKRHEIEIERKQINRRRRRLELIQAVIPHLSKRKNTLQELQAIGTVASLPMEFKENRLELDKKLHAAMEQYDGAKRRLDDLRQKKEGLAFSDTVLGFSQSVNNLNTGIDRFKKDTSDLPKLEGMRLTCRREAADYLKQVAPSLQLESIENLRPIIGKKRVVRELAKSRDPLLNDLNRAAQDVKRAELELQKVKTNLSQVPPSIHAKGIVNSVALVRKAGDIDSQIMKLQAELDNSRHKLTEKLRSLGLWKGNLSDIGGLGIPLTETLNRFSSEERELLGQQNQLHAELHKMQEELQKYEADLIKLENVADVPTEEELNKLRQMREAGWQLLRRRWIKNENIDDEAAQYADGTPLEDKFEEHTTQADRCADRLRREADRVHTYMSLKTNCQVLRDKINRLTNDKKELHLQKDHFDQKWQELWQPLDIMPLAPAEMIVWQTEMEKIRIQAAALTETENNRNNLQAQRKMLRDSLLAHADQLDISGEKLSGELGPILIAAENVIQSAEKRQRLRDSLTEKKADAEKNLALNRARYEQAFGALEQWKDKWQALASVWQPYLEIIPEEANDLLENLSSCFSKVREAEDFQKRIDGIGRDVDRYRSMVADVVGQMAPELIGQPEESIVMEMHRRINKVHQEKARLDDYENAIEKAETEVHGAQSVMRTSNRRLEELCAIAGCKEKRELPQAEKLFDDHRRLTLRLEGEEETLLNIAPGKTIDEIETLAKNADSEQLIEDIESLCAVIEEKEQEITKLSVLIGERKQELEHLGGNTAAIKKEEDAARQLAVIRRQAENYIRCKLAAKLLQIEIERFRAENEGPILSIASNYFSQLTLDSFQGLRTDEDSRGMPVLVGVREDKSRLEVGSMSSGTRDQLYLALRLASLEWRLQESESMPLIVDDVLVNFDDRRSLATLKVLAQFAEKVQVILFTHHSSILDAVTAIGNDRVIKVHKIDEMQKRVTG